MSPVLHTQAARKAPVILAWFTPGRSVAPALPANHGEGAPMQISRSFYSIPEFAASVGLSRPTVERMWRAGKVRTLTIGTRRVVPVDEIARLTATADYSGRAVAPVVAETSITGRA